MVEAGLKLYFITFRSLDADTDWDLMTCAASPAKAVDLWIQWYGDTPKGWGLSGSLLTAEAVYGTQEQDFDSDGALKVWEVTFPGTAGIMAWRGVHMKLVAVMHTEEHYSARPRKGS